VKEIEDNGKCAGPKDATADFDLRRGAETDSGTVCGIDVNAL